MIKRSYKDTSEQISLLGFGCMRFPLLAGTQNIDTVKSQEMVDYAIANGVNYFDTAYPYHGGQSESFIGDALSRYPRESFYLANKMPPWEVSCEADVERIFDKQLEKCKVDYFDFYLIHNIAEDAIEGIEKHHIYDVLKKKKAEGKIRHLGFSFHGRIPLLSYLAEQYEWDFAQLQINYMDWDLLDAKGQYEILTNKDIPVIVMEPVRGGALATLCDSSVEIFKKADKDASVASWAIRFAASLPNVMTVLSGMTEMSQVEDNIRTMNAFTPLTEKEYAIIDAALVQYRQAGAIPCTSCRYCMDCPAGVDIPKVFAIYNHFLTSKSADTFEAHYHILGTNKQAQHCINCGKCLEQCPQRIDIPERMKEITAFTEKNFDSN